MMVRRGLVVGVLGVATLVAAGVAGWQAYERDRSAGRMAVLQVELREARRKLADLETEPVGFAAKSAELEANLAAARQRLAVAETAVREAEDQLAAEISKRVALEAKTASMGEQLSAAEKAIADAEAKAERAVSELAKVEAVLPASRLAPRDLAAQGSRPDAAEPQAMAPETTASIGSAADEAVSLDAPEASSPAQEDEGPQTAPVTASSPKAEPKKAASAAKPARRVIRRAKAKPKKPAQKQYFLDSLFN